MNAGNQPLTIMRMDCNSAVLQATTTLKSAGYLVQKSFDLHSAIPAQSSCNCKPDSCACQMVILLVYAQEGPPVTLIFDSDGFQTIVNLANNSQQSADPGWIGKLAQLFPATSSVDSQMTTLVE